MPEIIRLALILQVVAERGIAEPWGVTAAPSSNCVILWDCRADADVSIISAVVRDNGGCVSQEAIFTTDQGVSFLGVIATRTGHLPGFADDIRVAYSFAMSPSLGDGE